MSKRIPILLGLILVFFAFWLISSDNQSVRFFIERMDAIDYDLILRSKNASPSELAPISIIDIDDNSLGIEGHWPWPRKKVGDLIDKLNRYGAKAIVFDIFFSEKQPNIVESVLSQLNQTLPAACISDLNAKKPFFEEDQFLAARISEGKVILANTFWQRDYKQNTLIPPLFTLSPSLKKEYNLFDAKGYISNIPVIQQNAKGEGFINVVPDTDGVARHAGLLLEYKEGVYPALSVETVHKLFGLNVKINAPFYGKGQRIESIQLGREIIPTDDRGQALIPFVGKSHSFHYYSATDVLHGKLPANFFQGQILIIGTSALGLGDFHAAPMDNSFPGVEIQATLLNGILMNNFSRIPAWTYGFTVSLLLFFGLLSAFYFPNLGPKVLGGVLVGFPVALLFTKYIIWFSSGIILSMFMPIVLVIFIALMNIMYGYIFETRKRQELRRIFGQYVPSSHIDEMLKSENSIVLRGENKDMTILFADIRNFTTISEGLSASQVVEMLNTFFTPMTEIIFKYNGIIDKYIGDTVMAFWGAPIPDARHERHALEAALDMQAKLKLMQPEFIEKGVGEIIVGIGINSGIMSVGDMGSKFRRNYTVLGDNVNLASRVEGLTKIYGLGIIVTEMTYQKNESRFVFRKLDRVRVKGKTVAVTLYELVCRPLELTPKKSSEISEYQQALDLYFTMQWDAAYEKMQALQKKFPYQKLYKLFLERIENFRVNPPPADWDGVYDYLNK